MERMRIIKHFHQGLTLVISLLVILTEIITLTLL